MKQRSFLRLKNKSHWFLIFILGLSTSAIATPLDPSEPSGLWQLDSVICQNGEPGIKLFELVLVQFDFGKIVINAELKPCSVNWNGGYSIVEGTNPVGVSIEMKSGKWDSCSGSIPSRIQAQFDWTQKDQNLTLTGKDLYPFANCTGRTGTLVFRPPAKATTSHWP